MHRPFHLCDERSLFARRNVLMIALRQAVERKLNDQLTSLYVGIDVGDVDEIGLRLIVDRVRQLHFFVERNKIADIEYGHRVIVYFQLNGLRIDTGNLDTHLPELIVFLYVYHRLRSASVQSVHHVYRSKQLIILFFFHVVFLLPDSIRSTSVPDQGLAPKRHDSKSVVAILAFPGRVPAVDQPKPAGIGHFPRAVCKPFRKASLFSWVDPICTNTIGV